jgi:hypothetical protein
MPSSQNNIAAAMSSMQNMQKGHGNSHHISNTAAHDPDYISPEEEAELERQILEIRDRIRQGELHTTSSD